MVINLSFYSSYFLFHPLLVLITGVRAWSLGCNQVSYGYSNSQFSTSNKLQSHFIQLLRPVTTQENKDRIGLTFFPSCIIRTAGPKNSLEYFNYLSSGLRITSSNWNRKMLPRKPMRGFNFVPIRSDPKLIFLS